MKPCPRCGDTNRELVEIISLANFEGAAQAVECLNCGFRGMAAEDDELAVKLWDIEAAKDAALEAAQKLTDGFIMTDSRGRVLVDHAEYMALVAALAALAAPGTPSGAGGQTEVER